MNLFKFRTTTHPTSPSKIGKLVSWDDMEKVIDIPGNLSIETISTNWAAKLSGLLNIKDKKAVSAGISDHDEPIMIETHIIRKPDHSFYMIDTGVSQQLIQDPAGTGIGWILRQYGGIASMNADPSTESILKKQNGKLKGVFLSHIHLDHVTGIPAIPKETPIYIGKNEANARLALNIIAQKTNDRMFAGRPPLEELPFRRETDGTLSGVVDVFGDQMFFAIPTPGHTVGHISFLARTPQGAVLFTGDVSHTRWGWDHDVEPGSYLADRSASIQSLKLLKDLSKRHPNMEVKLGHQD